MLDLAPLLLRTEEEAGQAPAGDRIALGTELHLAGSGLPLVLGRCMAADSVAGWECQGEESNVVPGDNDSGRGQKSGCRCQAPLQNRNAAYSAAGVISSFGPESPGGLLGGKRHMSHPLCASG